MDKKRFELHISDNETRSIKNEIEINSVIPDVRFLKDCFESNQRIVAMHSERIKELIDKLDSLIKYLGLECIEKSVSESNYIITKKKK